jgi:endo-1,4-beta-xylanase
MSFRKSSAKRLWACPLSLFAALVSIASLVFPMAPSLDVAAAEADAKPLAPQATVIAEYDFESGTQGWTGRGDASVAAVTDEAHSGSYSLEVTGRTDNWHGAQIDMFSLLELGATYTISGCVRLVSGEPANQIVITVAETPTHYERVASNTNVTDGDWVCMQGSYSPGYSLTGAVLYVESPTSTDVEYYIDDITIVMTAPPPPPIFAQYNFESSEQGWTGFGGVTAVAAVTDTARSGTRSLKVTGRAATGEGGSVELIDQLYMGATYTINGCVKLAEGESASTITYTIKETPEAYVDLVSSAPGGVTDASWVCMQGTYSFTTPLTGTLLYVQSDSATADYYLDDFSISMTAPPPPATIEVYDFETGDQGWGPFGGTTTDVVSDTAHSGTYSLEVTDRTASWQGAGVNVLGLLEEGATYTISGCTRLLTGLPVTQTKTIITVKSETMGKTSYDWVAQTAENAVTDAGWTCAQGSFSYGGIATELTLYVQSPDADAQYYIDDVSITRTSPPPPRLPIQADIPSISETYTPTFLIGAALEPEQLDSGRHAQLLMYHFNSLTAENAMKPGPIHPSEGTYNWTGADRLANFARASGMVMHGHTLEWHQQNAEWMLQDEFGDPLEATPENKALVLDRLRTHVYSVTERYGDVVNVWDVVNEVIDESQPDCMRRSEWYRLTGSDYISVAFNAAYEKVPTATLILNDYGTTNTTKRECIYTVVQDLQTQGVPVSGIGMQMHVNVENPSPAAIETTIERFAELGVEVHITELDVSVYTDNTTSYSTVPEELLIQQGYRYNDIFEVFKRQADHIGSVTFWGMADDHTWLTDRPIPRVDAPMPFDQQQQAKYAYWGIIGDLSRIPVLIQMLNVPQGTPTVDGSSELQWDMLPWTEVGTTGALTASFQTRWDAGYLYVIVDVEDATANVTDTVDIFIDENNDKTETYGPDDVHYTYQNGVCSPTVGVTCTAQPTANGYLLEAALPFSGTASVGTQIGFDVRVTDGSQPVLPISWNDPTHSQDTTTANWGTLTFIDAVKTTEAIHGLPVIDAIEDDAWAGANTITTDVLVEGAKEATATVKTMWGAGRLYVYAVVSDTFLTDKHSNAWEEDSIEVFVDQNNAKTSSYESDDSQYRVNYKNAQSVGNQTSVDDLTSATRILTASSVISPGEVITRGYVVELAIRLDEVAPSDGVLIGFDFQVNNDNNDSDGRDGVVTWNDPTGQSYQNTSRLGVLVFTGVEYTNYMPVIARNAAMSGDVSRPDRLYLR